MQATCYPDHRVIAVLKLNGADYSEKPVVEAGRTVTANGPEVAREFALKVLDTLKRGRT